MNAIQMFNVHLFNCDTGQNWKTHWSGYINLHYKCIIICKVMFVEIVHRAFSLDFLVFDSPPQKK